MVRGIKAMKAKSINGFTLIEILIALFIFSILSIISYWGLSRSITNSHHILRVEHNLQQLQMTLAIMNLDFSQVVDRPINTTNHVIEPALQGQNNNISFTRGGNINPLKTNSSLLRISYQLANGKLYRLIWPVLDRPIATKPIKQLLLSGVQPVQQQPVFQYYITTKKQVPYWPAQTNNAVEPNHKAQQNFKQNNTVPLAIVVTFKVKGLGIIYRIFRLNIQSGTTHETT